MLYNLFMRKSLYAIKNVDLLLNVGRQGWRLNR